MRYRERVWAGYRRRRWEGDYVDVGEEVQIEAYEIQEWQRGSE
jgi:hypothetical protein